MGFVGYEVVVRDGQRLMMVPYGPMGDYEPYEPEDSKDYFKKMLEGYLHAAAKGDVPQPYELTDEQCAALAKFIEENTDSLKEKVGSA